ncbi:hypothetical protein CRYUN_Cryun38cG0041500 [Craigia yunnanensis]
MNCKLAIEGKKGKPGQDGMMQNGAGAPGNAEMAIGGHGGGYGGPGGPGGYGGSWGGALSGSGGGAASGYVSGLGGPYGAYGGPGSTGYGELTGPGGGSSLYRFPPTSVGMPSGGYLESAHYSMSSSAAFPSQHHQGAGTSLVPRVPPGGMYPNGPPFY